MGMTISEKILTRTAGRKVTEGEYVYVKPDLVIAYAGITYFPPICAEAIAATPGLKDVGAEKVIVPEKNVIFVDHLYPPSNAIEAQNIKRLRQCARDQGIEHFYEREGIGHQSAAEKGFGRPGMMIVHFDNHVDILGAFGAYALGVYIDDLLQVNTTGETWVKVPRSVKVNLTGKLPKGVMARDIWHRILSDIGPDGAIDDVLEFTGPVVDAMSIDERMTICSLVSFCGAETGIMNPDQKIVKYLQERTREPFELVKTDSDARFEKQHDYDVSDLEPLVAAPPEVHHCKSISEVEGIRIDQALIGTCASGRMEDLRVAANILRGKIVQARVRMYITPASNETYLNAANEGLLEVFIRAGAIVTHPTCDTCYGRIGYLLEDERCIATATLNMPGRMGSPQSEIYLSSAATVAASAVKGEIADPREFLSR